MATTRPIFIPAIDSGWFNEKSIEFEWVPGLAWSQRRKCVDSLHQSATKAGMGKILEISNFSDVDTGRNLSAFNLKMKVDECVEPVTVEAAYQSSKVFNESGQQSQLLQMTDPVAVKALIRQFEEEKIISFRFEGRDWPTEPLNAFYDFLYIRALRNLIDEKPEVRETLFTYDAFTDIAFNPKRSINCQARACAIYVGMDRGGFVVSELLSDERLRDYVLSKNDAKYTSPANPPTLF